MSANPEYHFASREITAWLLGDSGEDKSRRIELHVAHCDRCTRIARENYLLLGFQPLRAPAPLPDPVPQHSWIPVLSFATAVLLMMVIARYPAHNAILSAVSGTRFVSLALLLTGTDPAVLRDGHATYKSSQLSFSGMEVPQEWKERAKSLARDGAVKPLSAPSADWGSLGERIVRMGGTPDTPKPDQVQLVSPRAFATLQPTPVFRWQAVNAATAYHLYIKDDHERQVLANNFTAGELQFQPDAQKLTPGGLYQWQVEASLGSRSPRYSEWRPFRIVADSALSAVRTFEPQFRKSPTLLTALYESYALYDDAAAQIQVLRVLNPRNAQVKRMQDQLAAIERAAEPR